MQRLGLDHDSLYAIKPDIITLSCTAYGHTGPWRAYGARARTVDAVCGMSALTGYEGGPALRASSNYMDHSGGLNVAYALLLALYQRQKTGTGMRLDLSMYETGVSCIAPALLETQRDITRPRLGTAHLWQAPHNVYPCQGADRWIAISVASDAQWQALHSAMGAPAWAADACFNTVQGRWQHRHEIDAHLRQWTATQEAGALMHALQVHGVPAGVVHTARDLVADPHLRERRYLEVFTNDNAPAAGPRVYAGRPFRTLPDRPLPLFLVSALGQHNLQLLHEVAGFSDTDIESLVAAGVIATQPGNVTRPAPGATTYQEGDVRGDPHYTQAVQTLVTAMR
jgi:benzylsuccinate CoA-transferase BbsF subunit